MTVPRWLLALVIATGLLAMHGITASAASASAPCGTVVPHEHHDATSDVQPTALEASEVPPLAGHAGALCLAVLIGGLVMGLLAQRSMRGGRSAREAASAPRLTAADRAPPDGLLSLLCVSRT